MSLNQVVLKIGTPTQTAAGLLIENKVSCLPIISDENALEGILSWRDIMKALFPPPPTTHEPKSGSKLGQKERSANHDVNRNLCLALHARPLKRQTHSLIP
jgi:CBS-domain-containing membrane protein